MANSYLSRTLGTSTNVYKGTVSHWIKRSNLGSMGTFAAWDNGGTASNRAYLNLYNDSLYFYDEANSVVIQTNRLLRDTSAWYHLVIAWDTSQGTASDRVKIYVNGVQETSFSTSNYPSQNATLQFNTSGRTFGVGCYSSAAAAAGFFDGYQSHFAFVDGQQLAPTVFGQTDSTSGIWKFKAPSGVTWGTNGVHLKFENSGALGTDSSGNSNTFTVQGNLKQALDTPSNVSCTMNPLDFGTGGNNATLSLGNTKAVSGGSNWRHSHGTLGVTTGKWYFEGKQALTSDGDTGYVFGFCDQLYDTTDDPNSGTPNAKFYGRQGTTFYTPSGKTDNYFPNSSAGDILMVALDLDNNKIWFGLNGTWHNTNGSAGNTSYSSTTLNSSYPDATSVTIDTSNVGVYMPIIGSYNDGYIEANFGNGFFGTTAITSAGSNGNGSLFEYDVPSGFYALNTKNINTYG